MNDTPIDVTTVPPPLPESTTQSGGFHLLRHGLPLLLLVICIMVGVYYLGQFLQGRLLNGVQTELKQVKTEKAVLDQHLTTLQTQLATLTTQLMQQQQQVEQLQQQQQKRNASQHNAEWTHTEIEYLLTIANHRLLLAQDPAGALTILQAAEARLRYLNAAALRPVHGQLLKDINVLKAVSLPDINRIATQLSHYAQQANDLPLVQTTRKAHDKKPRVESSGQGLWHDLQQLVKLRYHDEDVLGLLSVEQQQLIKLRLRVLLDNVRLLLLQGQETLFHNEVKQIQTWLQRYYDLNDNSVQDLQTLLQPLATLTLKPTLPDISGTLQALQRIEFPYQAAESTP